jgi:hypothetical protein
MAFYILSGMAFYIISGMAFYSHVESTWMIAPFHSEGSFGTIN